MALVVATLAGGVAWGSHLYLARAQGAAPQEPGYSTLDVPSPLSEAAAMQALAQVVLETRAPREQAIRDWNAWVDTQVKAGHVDRGTARRARDLAAAVDALATRVYEAPRPAAARDAHDVLMEGYFKLAMGMEYLSLYAATGDMGYRLEGNRLLNEAALLLRRGEDGLLDVVVQMGVPLPQPTP